MNIKGLNSLNIPVVPASASDKQIKSTNSEDRDAAGQYFRQKNKKRQPMSDEQFDDALVKLNHKKFMTEMHWTAKKAIIDLVKFAEVTDSTGQIIRSISEFDLWDAFSEDHTVESNKGQLLKRTA